MVRLSEIITAQEKRNEIDDERHKQVMDQLTMDMTRVDSENDELRKANADMKDIIRALQNENKMIVDSKKESSSMREEMRVKDFMIANLQKENNELKNQRATYSRELESVRNQIKELKVTAKQNKRQPLKDANKQTPDSVVLTFNASEDKL